MRVRSRYSPPYTRWQIRSRTPNCVRRSRSSRPKGSQKSRIGWRGRAKPPVTRGQNDPLGDPIESAYGEMGSRLNSKAFSPAAAGRLSRAIGFSAANSRRQNLFERSVKCGVEFCFFLVRVRCRTDSLRRACLCGVLFRKENRKDLQTARPKCARATEQIKSPHSPEPFAVAICKTRPGAAEVFLPGEECRVVIRPDVLDVFEDKNTFRSARQLSDGRKHGIWKNVALDPRIGVVARKVAANSLAKKQSILA